MHTSTNTIQYNINNYIKSDMSLGELCDIVGAQYFSPMETIDEIVERLHPVFIQKDYLQLYVELQTLCLKSLYQKHTEFNKNLYDKFFGNDFLKLSSYKSEESQDEELCDNHHAWMLEVLKAYKYQF